MFLKSESEKWKWDVCRSFVCFWVEFGFFYQLVGKCDQGNTPKHVICQISIKFRKYSSFEKVREKKSTISSLPNWAAKPQSMMSRKKTPKLSHRPIDPLHRPGQPAMAYWRWWWWLCKVKGACTSRWWCAWREVEKIPKSTHLECIYGRRSTLSPASWLWPSDADDDDGCVR